MNTFRQHLHTFLLSFLLCLALVSCDALFSDKASLTNHGGSSENEKSSVTRDTSINEKNAFSELSLDSLKLENYISSNDLSDRLSSNMRDFYNNRNYHFAWFTNDGLSQETRAFWNLHNSYLRSVKDSSVYDDKLHERMHQLLNSDEKTTLSPQQLTQTELRLTEHFFEYAKDAYEGSIDPAELQWYIPKKKVELVDLLDSLFKQSESKLTDWEPLNHNYQLLRGKLMDYYRIEKNGGFVKLNLNGKVFRKGDSAAAIHEIKARLRQSGDYTSSNTSAIYDYRLETAVKHAQRRVGLKADGVVGPATAAEFNVSAKQRIEQMLVNMERMKWMPDKQQKVKLVANIPEFRLHVYQNGDEKFNMKIVVGKEGHNSVVFSDKLEYVVFSPYWNVPESIVGNEILPEMQKDRNYLEKKNMEQTGTRDGLPVVRQKPGGDNALGRVKFIFPNNYNIYFHDTPAKTLFDQNTRAFSHGCIRVAQPERLAGFLLRNSDHWTDSNIFDAMYKVEEDWVKLKNPVPVYILYYTSWVDDSGFVNFRDDIYGHDREMKERMFEN